MDYKVIYHTGHGEDNDEALEKKAIEAFLTGYRLLMAKRALWYRKRNNAWSQDKADCTVKVIGNGSGLLFTVKRPPGYPLLMSAKVCAKELQLRKIVRQYWTEIITEAVDRSNLSGITLPFSYPVAVVFSWVGPKSRARDLDNQVVYRVVLDALIWAGVITDDDQAHVRTLLYQSADAPDDAERLEVTILNADDLLISYRDRSQEKEAMPKLYPPAV